VLIFKIKNSAHYFSGAHYFILLLVKAKKAQTQLEQGNGSDGKKWLHSTHRFG
jgi:hypothetical protein